MNVRLDIPVDGKTLILTGKNGSGKTHFLSKLYDSTYNIINHGSPTSEEDDEVLAALNQKNDESKSSFKVLHSNREETLIEERNKARAQNITPLIMNAKNARSRYAEHRYELQFFGAARISNIEQAQYITGLTTEREQAQSIMWQTQISNSLEKHLINLENRRATLYEYKDDELSIKINEFLTTFKTNLKFLLEDDSAELIFDLESTRIKIKRDGRPETTFQALSSGYSAIFNFYSELLLRSSHNNISPKELTGIAFIDEIEVHLHVSLQRLILPFLRRSFPKIQFIITTHSPFILTSIDDAVIYDLSNYCTIEEDISLYSYSAVMQGLLGTRPTSVILDKIIKGLAACLDSPTINTDELKELLKKITESLSSLDTGTKALYQRGINTLLERGEYNV